jgi:hypothetical protein
MLRALDRGAAPRCGLAFGIDTDCIVRPYRERHGTATGALLIAFAPRERRRIEHVISPRVRIQHRIATRMPKMSCECLHGCEGVGAA